MEIGLGEQRLVNFLPLPESGWQPLKEESLGYARKKPRPKASLIDIALVFQQNTLQVRA